MAFVGLFNLQGTCGWIFLFFFALGISAIIPLGESGIEHVVDPENQDAQGDGGCLGVHFRAKDTWGPPRFPSFLQNYACYRNSRHRSETCLKFVIQWCV
jgi:hypothetical protein